LSTVLAGTGLTPEEVCPTHLSYTMALQPVLWHGLVVPEDNYQWACRYVEGIPYPYLLVQPYSLASVSMNDHWPYWLLLIHEMATRTHGTVLLVAQPGVIPKNWNDDLPANVWRIENARSQADVFALSHLSAHVFTTSNSLAHYACIQELPVTIICNRNTTKRPNFLMRKVLVGSKTKRFSFHVQPSTVNSHLRHVIPER